MTRLPGFLDRPKVRENLGFARLCFALGWVGRALEVHERAVWMNVSISPLDERTRAWDDDAQCADDRECWDQPVKLAERLAQPWRASRGGAA